MASTGSVALRAAPWHTLIRIVGIVGMAAQLAWGVLSIPSRIAERGSGRDLLNSAGWFYDGSPYEYIVAPLLTELTETAERRDETGLIRELTRSF